MVGAGAGPFDDDEEEEDDDDDDLAEDPDAGAAALRRWQEQLQRDGLLVRKAG